MASSKTTFPKWIAPWAIALGSLGILGLLFWRADWNSSTSASVPVASATPTSSVASGSTKNAMTFPPTAELLKRCRALATLDLILSPEWEYRYYSFNSRWAPGEAMASMRDGCGDEWWLVFSDKGWAALKGLAHEAPAAAEGGEALSRALQAACPESIRQFAEEPAFRWDDTGFCHFRVSEQDEWKRANDLTPFAHLETGEEELLKHLSGTAEDYAKNAAGYFERELPLEIVQHVFDHKPITPEVVARLNPDLELSEIEEELHVEIGYPR
jgi:hypothetical protein